MIKKEKSHEKVTEKSINKITDINTSVRKSGNGTIIFGEMHPLNKTYDNTGFEPVLSYEADELPIFYDIDDVEKVY